MLGHSLALQMQASLVPCDLPPAQPLLGFIPGQEMGLKAGRLTCLSLGSSSSALVSLVCVPSGVFQLLCCAEWAVSFSQELALPIRGWFQSVSCWLLHPPLPFPSSPPSHNSTLSSSLCCSSLLCLTTKLSSYHFPHQSLELHDQEGRNLPLE